MATQEQLHAEAQKPYVGPLTDMPGFGFVTRRNSGKGGSAWRETVTQHMPESWPAARLALQARIAALDLNDD